MQLVKIVESCCGRVDSVLRLLYFGETPKKPTRGCSNVQVHLHKMHKILLNIIFEVGVVSGFQPSWVASALFLKNLS